MAENNRSKGANKEEDASPAGESASGGQSEDVDLDELLQQYFMQHLHIRGEQEEEEKPEQLLETLDLEGVAKYINSDKCKNIITMAGAGISTSAGIPDFRSPGTGLYDNLQKYNLPHPQAIFELGYFMENPEPFFVLAKELFPGSLKPTPCHYFLKLLESKGKLVRHYTQNIDTLERVAGMSGDKVVEAHGTFHTSHCLSCRKEYSLEWMKEQIFSDKVPPKCLEEDCDGVVKPDIVFFGESLPNRFMVCQKMDFPSCDLLIVMGTSLVVQPFASLTERVPKTTPRLYVNLEKTNMAPNSFMAHLFGGFDFDSDKKYRDVFLQSNCDDGAYALADLLGWGDELRALVKSEWERLEKEEKKDATKGGAAGKSSPSVSGKKTD